MLLGSEVLEVAIGVVLMFLLISLICSSVQEGVEGWLKWRAADLERGIQELLHSPKGSELLTEFYDHPLISSLFKGTYAEAAQRKDLPSYIPAANFAGAILDIAARGKSAVAAGVAVNGQKLEMKQLRETIDKLPSPKLKQAIVASLDTAEDDLNKAKANLEAWFNSSMDRVSGWYKRRTQLILFLLGLAAAVFLNIDTITVAQHLVLDKSLRDAVVEQAKTTTGKEDVDTIRAELTTKVGYPVGWNDWWPGPQKDALQCAGRTLCVPKLGLYVPAALLVLIGWLITAFATMLGAPFWFDVLNKFMVIRSTVKPHEKSREEASQDRQEPPTLELKLAGSAGGPK